MESERDKREHLVSLLDDFDTVMLVTQALDGSIHARPLGVAEIEPNGDLYFSTAIDSGKVRELAANPRAAVIAQGKMKWVSLSGTARVTEDRAMIARLWKESWKVWFPGGKDDPSLTLIHFDATSGEYWDSTGAKGIGFLIKAAKAYLTGKAERREGESEMNSKVSL